MAAMEEEGDSLEYFLNKAADPSRVDQDHNAVMSFCDRVNNELEGPQIAVRLLAHKIQSPQEREALHGLVALEACVQNCGGRFHQEIGKFRFLNEMIKVVSPKYLGGYTSETVKTRCVELMFGWSRGLPHEPKIKEAYSMLKKQGIVVVDPVLPDVQPIDVPPERTNTIFEDEDKSKQLARLLKSKNPEDLQAANRLIKNMVKQDMEKTEKKSKRLQELETVNNNIKLLSEMLSHYCQNSSESDKEILKELYDSLEKRRPNLFRLASDTDEKENEAMMEILKTNDAVAKVMSQYQSIVGGGPDENGLLFQTDSPRQSAIENRSNMDELGDIFGGAAESRPSAPASTTSGHADILGFNSQPPPAYGHASLSQTLFGHTNTLATGSILTQNQGLNTGSSTLVTNSGLCQAASSDISILDTSMPSSATGLSGLTANTNNLTDLNAVFSATSTNGSSVLTGILPQPVQPTNTQVEKPVEAQPEKRKGAFSELEDISQTLIKQQLGDSVSRPFIPSSTPAPKISLNEMQSASLQQQQREHQQQQQHGILTPTSPASSLIESPINSGSRSITVQPLTDVSVALGSIQPGTKSPLTAYDKNDIKIVIHFGRERPRPDVQVMVVSTMSTKPSAVKKFQFLAAVPKIMKVKLQTASATDLPAFNPILPSAAITQVMLVANPQNEKIRIKFKITCTVNDKTESDMGDIEITQS